MQPCGGSYGKKLAPDLHLKVANGRGDRQLLDPTSLSNLAFFFAKAYLNLAAVLMSGYKILSPYWVSYPYGPSSGSPDVHRAMPMVCFFFEGHGVVTGHTGLFYFRLSAQSPPSHPFTN